MVLLKRCPGMQRLSLGTGCAIGLRGTEEPGAMPGRGQEAYCAAMFLDKGMKVSVRDEDDRGNVNKLCLRDC